MRKRERKREKERIRERKRQREERGRLCPERLVLVADLTIGDSMPLFSITQTISHMHALMCSANLSYVCIYVLKRKQQSRLPTEAQPKKLCGRVLLLPIVCIRLLFSPSVYVWNMHSRCEVYHISIHKRY